MNEDWIYEDEDFDPDLPYIELQFGPEDLHLIYKSVCVHIDKWAGVTQMNKQDFITSRIFYIEWCLNINSIWINGRRKKTNPVVEF